MDKKKLLQQLQKEQKDLGQKIMALSNSLYFNEDMPAKDLVREQRQAMDNYFEVLEARILDLQQDLEDEEEDEKKKAEPNFLDGMFNDLNSDLDEMLEDLRKRCHNLVGDKHSNVTKLEDLEGREIINTNPPHCHECENDGTGCVKIILPGNQHLCAK